VNCGTSVVTTPLHRVNPLGELPAVWGCEPCANDGLITLNEPVDDDTRELLDTLQQWTQMRG
jgi:hypothetical protein